MLVSLKILIINSDGKILALRRSKTHPTLPFNWDLPGGLLKEGEDPIVGIIRETKEETEIDIGEIKLFDVTSGLSSTSENLVTIAFYAKVENPKVKISWEHDQYEWLTKEEFLSRAKRESIKRFLEKI